MGFGIEELVNITNDVLTGLKSMTSQIIDFLFNHHFTIIGNEYTAFSVIFGASVGVFLTILIIKFIIGIVA